MTMHNAAISNVNRSQWLDRALSVSIRKYFPCWGVFPDPRLWDVDPRVLGSLRISQNKTAHVHVITSILVSYHDRSRDRKHTG